MKLERSRTDSRLFGLCGGIARSAGVETKWIRLALVIGTIFTGGTLIFLYILASMVIPKEPVSSNGYWYVPAQQAYAYGGSYGAAFPGAFPGASSSSSTSSSTVDSMMQHLEEQAMNREIKELRSKLAQYEQQ